MMVGLWKLDPVLRNDKASFKKPLLNVIFAVPVGRVGLCCHWLEYLHRVLVGNILCFLTIPVF